MRDGSQGTPPRPAPTPPEDEPSQVPRSIASLPVVDAHIHAFPLRVFHALWRWFDEHAWEIRYQLEARAVVQFLQQRGVSQQVLLPYAHLPGVARGLNHFVAALGQAEPSAIPCATVFPGEEDARIILDEALGPLGCRGVKLHCHVQCMAPDDPRLDDVYAAAASHQCPVVIHAGDAPRLPGSSCDVVALCRPEALARALKRHPRTTVIVPHLGASLVTETAHLLEDHPNLFLDTTMALAEFMPWDPAMRRTQMQVAQQWHEQALALIRRWPQRILYGSDFPNLPYAWNRELQALARADLPASTLAAVVGGNARRLWGSEHHDSPFPA